MTGEDSPTEKRDEFNFGRSTPPPTTSHVTSTTAAKHDIGQDAVKTVAELPKEGKDKDDDKDEIDILRPDANPGYDPDEGSRRNRQDVDRQRRDKDGDGSDKARDKEGKKVDGSDRLDGQWIPPADRKTYQEEEEDDNCVVKCLYYTMQCCECSIS